MTPRFAVPGLTQGHRPSKRWMSPLGVYLMTGGLALLAILLAQNIVGVWPQASPAAIDVQLVDTVAGPGALTVSQADSLERRFEQAAVEAVRAELQEREPITLGVLTLTWSVPVSWDVRLILISLLFGALGSALHAGSSFLRFLGNRRLVSSWGPWYLFRFVVGAGLAVAFYMVLRAGFATTAGTPVEGLSHYTVAAFSVLVGLFTERATRKLAEVFDALFATAEELDSDGLGDAGAGGAPGITRLAPQWIATGHASPIRLEGSQLSGDVRLLLDGQPREFARVDGALSFRLPDDLRDAPGTIGVIVRNEAGESAPKRLVVSPGG